MLTYISIHLPPLYYLQLPFESPMYHGSRCIHLAKFPSFWHVQVFGSTYVLSTVRVLCTSCHSTQMRAQCTQSIVYCLSLIIYWSPKHLNWLHLPQEGLLPRYFPAFSLASNCKYTRNPSQLELSSSQKGGLPTDDSVSSCHLKKASENFWCSEPVFWTPLPRLQHEELIFFPCKESKSM